MLDGMDPRFFWPCFVLACLAASWFVLWLIDGLSAHAHRRRVQFNAWDGIAERRRNIERRGFSTLTGTR